MILLAINGSLMIYSVYDPSIQVYLADSVLDYSGNITDLENRMRFRGFMSFEGDKLGMINSLYFLFFLYLYPELDKSEKKLYAIGLPIMFFAILLSGRTGLITLSAILTIFGITQSQRFVIQILKYVIPIGGILILSYFLNLLPPEINSHIQWAFFQIPKGINILLGEHIFLPNDLQTYIFGGGLYNGPHPGGPISTSDSGFVGQIFATGIIGTFITWGVFSYYPRLIRAKNKYLIMGLICVYFIGNFKVALLFNQQLNALFGIILFLSIIDTK